MIEFNQSIPNDVYFVQDADPAVHHGSSLLAMIELGKDPTTFEGNGGGE